MGDRLAKTEEDQVQQHNTVDEDLSAEKAEKNVEQMQVTDVLDAEASLEKGDSTCLQMSTDDNTSNENSSGEEIDLDIIHKYIQQDSDMFCNAGTNDIADSPAVKTDDLNDETGDCIMSEHNEVSDQVAKQKDMEPLKDDDKVAKQKVDMEPFTDDDKEANQKKDIETMKDITLEKPNKVDVEIKGAEGGVVDVEIQGAEGGVVDVEIQGAEGGVVDVEVQGAEGGVVDVEIQGAEGGVSLASISDAALITEDKQQAGAEKASDDIMMDYRSSEKVVKDGSSDSSDSSDDESDHDGTVDNDTTDVKINKVLSKERDLSPDREKRVKLNRYGFEDIRTKGEILPEELPPIEELTVTVDDTVLMSEVGKVRSVVGTLVVIQANEGVPALNTDTILFVEGHKVLGQVFEVFGNVLRPWYTARFNDPENITNKGVTVGTTVFAALKEESFTKYVFVESLRKMKGSDASWEDNNEPPAKHLDFSDDEEEKRAKAERKNKNKELNTDNKNREDKGNKNTEKQSSHGKGQSWPPTGPRPGRAIRGGNVFAKTTGPSPSNHQPNFCKPYSIPTGKYKVYDPRWPRPNRDDSHLTPRFGGQPRFMARPNYGQYPEYARNQDPYTNVHRRRGDSTPVSMNHGAILGRGPRMAESANLQTSQVQFSSRPGICPPFNFPSNSNFGNPQRPPQFTQPQSMFMASNQSSSGIMYGNNNSIGSNANGGGFMQQNASFNPSFGINPQVGNTFAQNGNNLPVNANNLQTQAHATNFGYSPSQNSRNFQQNTLLQPNFNNGSDRFPTMFKVHGLNPGFQQQNYQLPVNQPYEQVNVNATNVGPYRPEIQNQTDTRVFGVPNTSGYQIHSDQTSNMLNANVQQKNDGAQMQPHITGTTPHHLGNNENMPGFRQNQSQF